MTEIPMIPYNPLTGPSSADHFPYEFENMPVRIRLAGVIAALPLYFLLLANVLMPKPMMYLFRLFGITDTTHQTIFYNLAFQIIMLILLLILFRSFLYQSFRDLVKRGPANFFKWWSLGYVCFFAANIAASVITVFINGTESQSANQQLVEIMAGADPSSMVIIGVILAPIVEELVFRGIIFRTIRPAGRIAAIIVSASAFGFTHVAASVAAGNIHELILVIPYIAMGLSLSILYEMRRNILLPICVHMTQNALSFLILLLLGSYL